MALKPRWYQSKAIIDICRKYAEGFNAPLFVLPTGGGKTVIISDLAQLVTRKAKSVLILVHRQELIKQTSDKLIRIGQSHGIIWKKYQRTDHLVQVASIQTLVRRKGKYPPFDLIIIDEAHRATAKTYKSILAESPNSRILGVTATPERADGTGLDGIFDCLVLGPTIGELTDAGFLVPCSVWGPPRHIDLSRVPIHNGDFAPDALSEEMDKPSITGDALREYQRIAPGRKALAFCVSVKHAKNVAKQFTAAGVPADVLYGDMSDQDRARVLDRFSRGAITVLVTRDIATEGFDDPSIEVGIGLRPTKSRGLHRQMGGRIFRPFPGKEECIFLDHADNCLKRHGMFDDEPEWSLKGKPKKARGESDPVPASRECPKCYRVFRPAPVCPECGYVFVVRDTRITHIAGELVPISKAAIQRATKVQQAMASTLEELIEVGKKRGMRYPQMWAEHVLKGREKRDGVSDKEENTAQTGGEIQGAEIIQ